MLATSLFALALAATGFAQTTPPAGYRKVYITSMVDAKYVVVPKAASAGSTLVVQTLTSKPEQQWYLTDGDSQIMLASAATPLCMDGGAKSNWKDMGNVYVNACDTTAPGQAWTVMADGRIALKGSSPQECLDLQYMRATANNPVGMYSCAGLGNIGAKDKGINWPLVNATTF